MNEPNYSSLVSKPTPVKLEGAKNYRSWAKDMEMVMLRMKAWHQVTHEPPAVAARDDAWLERDIWARSEIHLWCSPDQQDLIHDTSTAYESWKILKDQYSTKSDLKTARLMKEFASAVMLSTESCTDFVRKVKRIVSELRDCGTSMKERDVAYTILMGLPKEYSSLVITLTNMSTPESPLLLEKTIEAIYTEEMRLKLFESADRRPDLEQNPLALKHDTQYRGSSRSAYVARSQQSSQQSASRSHPYRDNRDNRDSRDTRESKDTRDTRDRDAIDNRDNAHYGKRCYNCGGWNHISNTCWHLHPELRPYPSWRSRHQDSENAYGTVRDVKQANVAEQAVKPEEKPSALREHPFEFNMIMVEQLAVREAFRNNLNDLLNTHVLDTQAHSILLTSQGSFPQRRWLLDSGASSHYIKEPGKFRSYTWLDNPVKILTGRGPVWGVARGEAIICLDIGKVIIKDVLLVPELDVDADLLSVAALLRSGISINFDSDKASFLKDGVLWGTAKPVTEGGLFFVDEYEDVEDYALAMQCVDKQPFITWHCRLGHINGRAIRSMAASGKVTGMEIGDPVPTGERNIDCADCL